MFFEELAIKILKEISKEDLWYRVIALDFETHVENPDEDFLTDEFILGISLARRSYGKINKKIFILKDEKLEIELELLKELSKLFQKNWRPLVVIGYGHNGYDLPLLAMKKQKLEHLDKLWGIGNAITGSIHIDLIDICGFIFEKIYREGRSYRKKKEVMIHPHFKDQPFLGTESKFASLGREEKGIQIYESWKNKDPEFAKYLESEAHDILLIAEKIIETEIKEDM